MITQVSGINTGSVGIDPRRKARSLQFKSSSNDPYKTNYHKEYRERRERQRDAVWKAVLFISGSALFMLGCFLFSNGKKIKK